MPRMDFDTALGQLKAPEVRLQMLACTALGEHGLSTAAGPLSDLLGEQEDNAVRIHAAQALGKIGAPSALAALELTPATNNSHDMYGEVSSTFASAATRIRQHLSSSERRDDIRRLARGLEHSDDNVAARCAQGIVDWGSDALKALKAARDSESPAARARAANAMGRIGGQPGCAHQTVGLLLGQLKDPALPVRLAAIMALRYRRDDRVPPRLLPLLRDPEPRVRLQAMLTLETIDTFEAMDEFARMAAEDHAVLGPLTRLDESAASVLRTMRQKQAQRSDG